MSIKRHSSDMTDLARAVEDIAARMPSEETLRTDHPLMGQTFEPLAFAITEGLADLAAAIRELAEAVKSLDTPTIKEYISSGK